jgi:hypothetical protein
MSTDTALPPVSPASGTPSKQKAAHMAYSPRGGSATRSPRRNPGGASPRRPGGASPFAAGASPRSKGSPSRSGPARPPGVCKRPSHFPPQIGFVWRFCMGAQGA